MADYIAALNPWANAGDTTAPDTSKVNLGWIPSEQPPAPWLNWMTNRGDNKINQTVAFINNIVGPITIASTDGTKILWHPATPGATKWSGESWLDLNKTVWDQMELTERLTDQAFDQAAQMFPALQTAGSNAELCNTSLFIDRPRGRFAPWTDPKNAHADSGNFWPIHTKEPWRLRVTTHNGHRSLVSGYRQDGAGGSAVMLKFSSGNFTDDFEMTYTEFLAKAELPGGILVADIELEDFVVDVQHIWVQVSVEDPVTPGEFTLFVSKFLHEDGSLDFDTVNWTTSKLGAGGTFTRDPRTTNAKANRHSLEYLGNQRIVSAATYVRPANATGAVLKTFAANGDTMSASDAVLPAADYYIETICGDGEFVFCAIDQGGANNKSIGAVEINDLATLNPNFPVSPTTDNAGKATMKCDGHYVYYFQDRFDTDDMLIMKADSGIFARVGMEDYVGLGLNPTIVAATTDGTALWLLLHQGNGGPDGLLVTLVRLDPTSIFPGNQLLKDLQRRYFFIDTEVDLDTNFFGDLFYTGRDILITWDQLGSGPDAGKLARFANSNNR